MPTADDLAHARLLWDYLRLGAPVHPAECLLVFGGHDIGVARRAAELYADGVVPLIIVSGGSRAVPDGSGFPTEADAIADVLLSHGVPKDAISLERLATNTSENFWLSAELLRDLGMAPRTYLAVAKPYAERRIIATARRRWSDKQVAVTSEQVEFDDYLTGDIPADRVLSMLAGEALRLEAYSTTGLINPAEPVPGHILDAAHALQAAGFSSRAVGLLCGTINSIHLLVDGRQPSSATGQASRADPRCHRGRRAGQAERPCARPRVTARQCGLRPPFRGGQRRTLMSRRRAPATLNFATLNRPRCEVACRLGRVRRGGNLGDRPDILPNREHQPDCDEHRDGREETADG